jgi:hypothetical protein
MIWDGLCGAVSSYGTSRSHAFYFVPSEPLFIAFQGFGASLLITASPAATSTPASTSTETAASALAARPATFSMVGTWTRFIYIHLLPPQILPVEILDGCLGFSLLGHLNKTKPPRLATVFVFNNACRADLAIGLKSLPKIFPCDFIRQIPDINIHRLPPFVVSMPSVVFRKRLSLYKKNPQRSWLEVFAGIDLAAQLALRN